MKKIFIAALIIFFQLSMQAQKPRARDIGIPFNGTPGKYNAITDVKGIEVGYSTIISGSGKNIRGKGPVRTGVTADDIASICVANGVHDAKTIDKIIDDSESDLRRVKRRVHAVSKSRAAGN